MITQVNHEKHRTLWRTNLSDSLCRKSVTLLLSTRRTKDFGLLFLHDLAVRVEFSNALKAWHVDSFTLVEVESPDTQKPLRCESFESGTTFPRQSMIRLSRLTKVTK